MPAQDPYSKMHDDPQKRRGRPMELALYCHEAYSEQSEVVFATPSRDVTAEAANASELAKKQKSWGGIHVPSRPSKSCKASFFLAVPFGAGDN
jgi:hypothetical protein